MTGAAFAKVAGSALRRDQRDGCFRTLLRGVCGGCQGILQWSIGGERGLEGFNGRSQRVHHRFLPALRPTAGNDALQGSVKASRHICWLQFLLASKRNPRAQERRAVEWPTCATD